MAEGAPLASEPTAALGRNAGQKGVRLGGRAGAARPLSGRRDASLRGTQRSSCGSSRRKDRIRSSDVLVETGSTGGTCLDQHRGGGHATYGRDTCARFEVSQERQSAVRSLRPCCRCGTPDWYLAGPLPI